MSIFLYEARVKFHGESMDDDRLDEMAEEFEARLLELREEFEQRYGVTTELES